MNESGWQPDASALAQSKRRLRILFVMRHFLYLRNYEATLRALAAEGHQVILGFEENPSKVDREIIGVASNLAKETQRIEICQVPVRSDRWTPLAHQLRSLRNYSRYLTPQFERAKKCARRAESYLMPQLRWFGRAWLSSSRLSNFLALLEFAIPLDRKILDFIAHIKPDVVAVTPLIDFSSTQVDYVKSARALGIPSVHCVASWDNLTNKGIVLIEPDRMLLWNEMQRQEAVALHGVPPNKVVVTGAQLFDDWFSRKPSRDRTQFCKVVGLDTARPFILYTCSSVFIARHESEFFKRWLRGLRSSRNDRLRTAGVLVRPHPGSTKYHSQWDDPEIREAANVAVYPRHGGYPVTDAARDDYFDSLFHCAGVVGINTSAMLEAGIVGKRCYSVLDSEIAESQEGMLHFAHLTRGGFLRTAHSFEEHFEQLAGSFGEQANSDEQLRSFVGEFLRPHGIAKPATPIVVDAIEAASLLKAAPIPRWPLIFSFLLFPFAVLLHAALGHRRAKKWGNVDLRVAYQCAASKEGKAEIAHDSAPEPVDMPGDVAGMEKPLVDRLVNNAVAPGTSSVQQDLIRER